MLSMTIKNNVFFFFFMKEVCLILKKCTILLKTKCYNLYSFYSEAQYFLVHKCNNVLMYQRLLISNEISIQLVIITYHHNMMSLRCSFSLFCGTLLIQYHTFALHSAIMTMPHNKRAPGAKVSTSLLSVRLRLEILRQLVVPC